MFLKKPIFKTLLILIVLSLMTINLSTLVLAEYIISVGVGESASAKAFIIIDADTGNKMTSYDVDEGSVHSPMYAYVHPSSGEILYGATMSG